MGHPIYDSAKDLIEVNRSYWTVLMSGKFAHAVSSQRAAVAGPAGKMGTHHDSAKDVI